MLNLFKTLKTSMSIAQMPAYAYHVTQKPFINISEEKLKDYNHIRDVLKKNVINSSRRAQRGLYHGKRIASGNKISETGSTTRRKWKPNLFKKEFYSELLKKKIELEVSSKAWRCIRLYGGFDNYILLTKPKNLDSKYGEYLRTLMMRKVENPEYDVDYIVASRPITYTVDKKKVYFNGRPEIWYPKDLRYTDLSQEQVKTPTQMSKMELAKFKEITTISENIEDAGSSPLIQELKDQYDREAKILEPDRQLAIANWQKQKSKKFRLRTEEAAREAREQGYIADNITDLSRKHKKYTTIPK